LGAKGRLYDREVEVLRSFPAAIVFGPPIVAKLDPSQDAGGRNPYYWPEMRFE